MLKPTNEWIPSTVTRKELVHAAKAYLLKPDPPEELVVAQDINSIEYGSSDLLFVNRTKAKIIVAKIRHPEDEESGEKFLISSLCYYFWLMEVLVIGEILLKLKPRLDLYLFSHDFSLAVFYLVDNLIKEFPIHLIRCTTGQAEDLPEPAIHFQDVTLTGVAQSRRQKRYVGDRERLVNAKKEPMSLKILPEELSEFYRLTRRYLA
jgi:hypothetical protein